MAPEDLAKCFQRFLEEGELSGPAAAFLRSLNVANLSKENSDVTLGLLALADTCKHVFQLPHLGAKSIYLVGSIYVRDPQKTAHSVVFSGGRGHSFADAFFGCMGELAERLAYLNWDGQNSDPSAEHVALACSDWWQSVAGGSTDETSVLVTGRRLRENTFVNFPFSRSDGIFASSTGCSFAADLDTAIEGAALEVVERVAVQRWWYEGVAASQPNPICSVELARVFPPGQDISRHRWLLDLTGPDRIPVVAALSCNAHGEGLVMGVSAAKTDVDAARSASLELCQMEAAALMALAKRDQLGVDKLNPSETVWIERWTSAPVHHARPLVSAPPAMGQNIMNVLDHFGDGYVFELGSPIDAGNVVRVISTRVAPSMELSEMQLEAVKSRPRFDPSNYPAPL